MKTRSFYIAALLIIGAAVTTIAKEAPATGMAVISTQGSPVVKVIYKGETAGRVKLNIFDSAAKLVYTETKNSVDGFILPLNFSGLSAGEYTIVLTDATGTKSEKINFQPAPLSNNVHVSKISNDGKFLLSVTKKADENITVKIYDGFNNLVHNSSNQVSGDFAQVYFIKNYSGSCTFEVTGNNGVVTSVRF